MPSTLTNPVLLSSWIRRPHLQGPENSGKDIGFWTKFENQPEELKSQFWAVHLHVVWVYTSCEVWEPQAEKSTWRLVSGALTPLLSLAGEKLKPLWMIFHNLVPRRLPQNQQPQLRTSAQLAISVTWGKKSAMAGRQQTQQTPRQTSEICTLKDTYMCVSKY